MPEFKSYNDADQKAEYFILKIPHDDLHSLEFTKSEKTRIDTANSPFASYEEVINTFEMILKKLKESYDNPKIKEIHYRNSSDGRLIWGDSLIFRSAWKPGDTMVYNSTSYGVSFVEVKNGVMHVYLDRLLERTQNGQT